MGPELTNNHNVYILGSGFSREAGMPLILDFLERMRDCSDWLGRSGRRSEFESVANVLEFRRDASSAAYWTRLDLENIEELFSLASAHPGKPSKHLPFAIAATLDYCDAVASKKKIALWMPKVDEPARFPWLAQVGKSEHFEVDRYTCYLAGLLGAHVNGAQIGKNSFLTFNYDTVLEGALDSLHVPYGYGFSSDGTHYHASTSAMAENYPTKVLKLHGSVNWAGAINGGKAPFTVYGTYRDVLRANAMPALVPPTWKKSFKSQLAEVWASAIESLKTATRIVVIGFSMPRTDMHFKYLLAAGLQGNISLRRLIFVDPGIELIRRRAKEMLRNEYILDGRIAFVPMKLSEFSMNSSALREIGRPVPEDLSPVST